MKHDKSKKLYIGMILDTMLSDRDLDLIKEGWPAFYNEPNKFKQSTVPNCVYRYLIEQKQQGRNCSV